MIRRIIRHWVYGGFLAGFLLLGLMAACCRSWTLPLVLVFLQLPVYMLHQFEEHDDDRFRRFVNSILGQGREILSEAAVFVINIPGVWGVNLLSIILACTVDLGFGLIAVYLTLVNAVVHLVQAIHLKRYNPGLITAVLLFLPAGGIALWSICATGTVHSGYHLLGAGSALAIHLAIVAYVVANLRKLNSLSGRPD